MLIVGVQQAEHMGMMACFFNELLVGATYQDLVVQNKGLASTKDGSRTL